MARNILVNRGVTDGSADKSLPGADRPAVTFLVPCYRLAHLLTACVESILAQTFEDFEVLILDDCSPDETPAVARSFGDARVRHVRHPQNLGHLRNYNAGLALARGRYVWLISADDRLRGPDALARAMRTFAAHPDVEYVFSPAMALRDGRDAGVVSFSWDESRPRLMDGPRFVTRTLLRQNVIASPACIARRDCYERAGGFPLALPYAGDWYLWCRFAFDGPVAFLPEPLADYRFHESSMTQAFVDERSSRIVADEIAVRWRIMHDARIAGLPRLARAAARAIVADYVARLVLFEAARAPEGLTIERVTDSIAAHAANPTEASRFRALLAVALGDRAYASGNWAEAARQYDAAAAGAGSSAALYMKRALLALGPAGTQARRAAARVRSVLSRAV